MNSKEIIKYLKNSIDEKGNYCYSLPIETTRKTIKCIEEKDKEIEILNNIINTMLEFNFFAEECPLNLGYTEKCNEDEAQNVFYEDNYCEENCNDDYKKCWLKYFKRLQELKGSNNNE